MALTADIGFNASGKRSGGALQAENGRQTRRLKAVITLRNKNKGRVE